MCTPQAGTLSTNLVVGTTIVEETLCTGTTNTIVLLEGALVVVNEVDRPMVSTLKGIGINMVSLPREKLHVLQDGIILELRASESYALQVLSE